MSKPEKVARRHALGWMAGAAALLRTTHVRARAKGAADAGAAGAPTDVRRGTARQPANPLALVAAHPGPLDVAFEGGGMKGAAFAGAVEVLLGQGFKLRRLIGSSAGAITAAFLAAGYSASELATVLGERVPDGTKRRFSTFLEPPAVPPAPPNVSSFKWSLFALGVAKAVESGSRLGLPLSAEALNAYARRGLSLFSTGAFADDGAFLAWMEDSLERKGIPRDTTLGELQQRLAPRGVQLSLAATDVSAQRLLILNHHTAPDVPLLWAVRMSMGIPIVWPEVEWKERWGLYRGQPMLEDGVGHHVVDGGVLSNFPLKYLIEPRYTGPAGVLGAPSGGERAGVLGILLDETRGARKPSPTPAKNEKGIGELVKDNVLVMNNLSRLLDTMTGAWDLETIEEHNAESLICRVPVRGFDTLDFDMSDEAMAELVESGRAAMKQYLA
jgi:predicted acylesterase/phospholipase RssA